MAEGVAENYSQDRAGRWLARARLLAEEIPTIRNQALEARVFAKWLPAVRSENAERLYLRGVALEHMIIQTRATSRALFDIRLGGGMSPEINSAMATLLSSVSYALSVNAEDFRFDPYSATKEPTTAEIRLNAESATTTVVSQASALEKSQLARLMTVISSATILSLIHI